MNIVASHLYRLEFVPIFITFWKWSCTTYICWMVYKYLPNVDCSTLWLWHCMLQLHLTQNIFQFTNISLFFFYRWQLFYCEKNTPEIYPLLKLQYRYIMENVSIMIWLYQINEFVQKFKKYKETRYKVFLCSGATIYKDYGMKRQMP